ncbi:MAG: DUF4364 family protein [Oscillospiraceae bacterium]|nr:DUF4364 family protein [Oscillospiraceae bacterium]
MGDDGFLSAGVLPGGLHSREEIRLLLCFLADRLAQPLTEDLAEQVFAREGLANYFEYTAALHELLEAGQLVMSQESGETVLRLDKKVTHAANELAQELPRRVRDRALHAAEQLQAQNRREQENGITEYPADGEGCYMTFRQGKGSDMLLRVTAYAPDRDTAQAMRERFLEDPGKVYRAVIEALS